MHVCCNALVETDRWQRLEYFKGVSVYIIIMLSLYGLWFSFRFAVQVCSHWPELSPKGGNRALQVYNGCLAAQLANRMAFASRSCFDFLLEPEPILVLTLVVAADSAANRVDSGATRIYAESLGNPEVDPKQAQNHPKIEID